MRNYMIAVLMFALAFSGKAVAKVRKAATTPVRAAAKAKTHLNKHLGMASWYGKQHEGKRMSNGKPFHRKAMTAASKTLALGTICLVLNLDNYKSVMVEVTDHGPYKGNRIMDLSEAAARKLDFVDKGLTKVLILPIPEPISSAIPTEI